MGGGGLFYALWGLGAINFYVVILATVVNLKLFCITTFLLNIKCPLLPNLPIVIVSIKQTPSDTSRAFYEVIEYSSWAAERPSTYWK